MQYYIAEEKEVLYRRLDVIISLRIKSVRILVTLDPALALYKMLMGWVGANFAEGPFLQESPVLEDESLEPLQVCTSGLWTLHVITSVPMTVCNRNIFLELIRYIVLLRRRSNYLNIRVGSLSSNGMSFCSCGIILMISIINLTSLRWIQM